MAKLAIACPVCGKYAEAKTGFFAKKKIECACGNIMAVDYDKATAVYTFISVKFPEEAEA